MALILQGTVVPVSDASPDSFDGRVYLGDDGLIESVSPDGARAPKGFAAAPVVDTGAVIYPGLIDLHSHVAYNTLPLWVEKGRVDPWRHHNSWTSADSYHTDVVWPTGVLGYAAGPALLAYIGLKALVGGTTSIQGSVSKPKLTYPWVVRVVENEKLGPRPDALRASVLTITDPKKLAPYVEGMNGGQGFIYHCAEGQPGSVVTKEYDAVGTALGLQENLIAVHCTALTRADFDRWTPKPGTVVWSPFSNLWLYGMTTDVVAATEAGLTVALGSDWSPSGTKHLLGELKVADLHNRQSLGGHFSDRALVEMATANPGRALSGPWEVPCGQLVDGGLADLVVVSKRDPDPWRNLIAAVESDVLLTVIGGTARYGTRELMEACAASPMGAVTVRGQSRRVSIPRLDDTQQHWSLTEIRQALNAVRKDPAGAVDRARNKAQAWAMAAAESPASVVVPDPPLVVIPDLPTADTMTAGLPPDPATTRIPPLDTLVHDPTFFRRVGTNPIHGGQLDGLRAYYYGDDD